MCTAYLIHIALFFCMRSCEYTKTQSHRHTVQFRFRDIQFHNEDGSVPQYAPDKNILHARYVTLFLDTQNNCVQGESTTMEDTNLEHGNHVSASA